MLYTSKGVAPPTSTYYCSRNTHIPKEKSWNESKNFEWSSTESVVNKNYKKQ